MEPTPLSIYGFVQPELVQDLHMLLQTLLSSHVPQGMPTGATIEWMLWSNQPLSGWTFFKIFLFNLY